MILTNTRRRMAGLTIIEATIALVVLAIAVIGAINFRYRSSLDTTRANLRDSAARVSLMLCEGWRGLDGSEEFDPVQAYSDELAIAETSGPSEPNGFTVLGKYTVVLDDVKYFAVLSYKDIDADLRELNVTVAWQQRMNDQTQLDDVDKSYTLATYTEQ